MTLSYFWKKHYGSCKAACIPELLCVPYFRTITVSIRTKELDPQENGHRQIIFRFRAISHMGNY
jgi:hypothetical protein